MERQIDKGIHWLHQYQKQPEVWILYAFLVTSFKLIFAPITVNKFLTNEQNSTVGVFYGIFYVVWNVSSKIEVSFMMKQFEWRVLFFFKLRQKIFLNICTLPIIAAKKKLLHHFVSSWWWWWQCNSVRSTSLTRFIQHWVKKLNWFVLWILRWGQFWIKSDFR